MLNPNEKISLADFSHKRELTELWIEAFEDDEKFIKSFLDSYMIPEYNVPVMIADGKIASAFYLIEFELYSNMKSVGTCVYLFAAATKKEYQNRGYMSKLIGYAAELCKNRGLKAIFLFPQSESLFSFYARFGFESIYQAKKIKLNNICYDTKKDFKDFSRLSLKEYDITDTNIFDELYKSYVEFTAKQDLAPLKDRLFYFKCASSYLDTSENKFAIFERKNDENSENDTNRENNVEKFCYVFYKKDKNTYYIDDIIISEYIKIRTNMEKKFEETADLLADYILSQGNGMVETVEINVLPTSFSGSQNVKTAMILPLSDSIAGIVKNLKSPVYLNMFMNM